ncbi:MAG: PilZ domain-containing protein [Pelagimonas sp.]|uniref:PilZ domain-containing protein n=1 Tax=Pelagimonas sp. TaxID=2073170 RepID=UPI003D6AF563
MLQTLFRFPSLQKLTPRRYERYLATFTAHVTLNNKEYPCKIRDVSAAGAMVEFADDPRPFDEMETVKFSVPGHGACDANLRWIEPFKAGLEFRITEAEKAALSEYLYARLSDQF